MKQQSFCNFLIAGVSLTDYGLKIPSPFVSLTLDESQIDSMTSWTLNCSISGDSSISANIAAMEALLYSAAQSSSDSSFPFSFISIYCFFVVLFKSSFK